MSPDLIQSEIIVLNSDWTFTTTEDEQREAYLKFSQKLFNEPTFTSSI